MLADNDGCRVVCRGPKVTCYGHVDRGQLFRGSRFQLYTHMHVFFTLQLRKAGQLELTTAGWRFLNVVDVFGWNGRSALVLRCGVDPAAAVLAVEVNRLTRVVELTQRHTAVSRRTNTD